MLLIARLNRQDGITILMISHDIGAALTYATHILHMGEKILPRDKAGIYGSDIGRRFTMPEGGEMQ